MIFFSCTQHIPVVVTVHDLTHNSHCNSPHPPSLMGTSLCYHYSGHAGNHHQATHPSPYHHQSSLASHLLIKEGKSDCKCCEGHLPLNLYDWGPLLLLYTAHIWSWLRFNQSHNDSSWRPTWLVEDKQTKKLKAPPMLIIKEQVKEKDYACCYTVQNN